MTRILPPQRLPPYARTLGIVAVILVCLGCTSPAAQESQVPSATTPDATQSPAPSSPPPSTETNAAGLIFKLDGAGPAGRIHIVTVFDDGRVIITGPDGQGGASPPVERRLTAAGVELVRDELAAASLPDASVDYMPVPNPGIQPPGYGGAGPSLEVGLPDGGTALITWYLFADTEQDYFQPQPEAEALDAIAAHLSRLEDWLPADAWVDANSDAPTVAIEAPDGILPPNSIVVAVVDGLQLRAEPGLAADVTGSASAGDRFSVAGWFGPVSRDGLDWYMLGPATVGDLSAWAAAGSGAEPYLELVPPDCPTAEPDLATLIEMASDWNRLECFGDRSLTLEGTFGCGYCDGTMAGNFAPFWLAWPLGGQFLWADFHSDVGPLVVHAAPDSGVELPAVGSIVRVTGHFSDPISATCTMSTFIGEQATAVDQRTAELYCRERFVLVTLEVIGTDPTYTDPYNP